ncbi:MAG: Transcriptional regulator, AraC family protein [Myxococcaceae bacterium]|nr:Transcriptional regulator, AraC family protein [Myxococcaceae bacterium]
MLTKQVLAALSSPGLAFRVAAQAGLELHTLDDQEARIAHPVHLALWRHAADASGDALFGLRVAKTLETASYGVLGYAMASSATLGDAWRRLQAYSALLYDELTLREERRSHQVVFKYELAGDAGPPALFEAALASFVLNARRLTAGRFQVTEVRLRHASQRNQLARHLAAPVYFERAENAIVAEAASLQLPIASADPGLAALLERYASELLGRLPRADDFVEQVRRFLLATLPSGVPSAEQAASRLGLSVRTLQRRLRDQGVGFRALVDRVRHEVAVEHLATPHVSVAQVAFMLGFSEDNAFDKAFRRWTGMSPSAFRRTKQSSTL